MILTAAVPLVDAIFDQNEIILVPKTMIILFLHVDFTNDLSLPQAVQMKDPK